MTPHEGPSTSLPELGLRFESAGRAVDKARRRMAGLLTLSGWLVNLVLQEGFVGKGVAMVRDG